MVHSGPARSDSRELEEVWLPLERPLLHASMCYPLVTHSFWKSESLCSSPYLGAAVSFANVLRKKGELRLGETDYSRI